MLWAVTMSLLLYKHYGSQGERTQPQPDLLSDLTEKTAVPFNLRLPDNISYLRVGISGVDLSQFDMQGGRQKLDGSILTIYRDTGEERQGSTDAAPSAFLRESFSVKSKDPATVSLSRKIVKGETDPTHSARLIHDWVFGNIEKVRTISLPISTEALRTRKGDCNEHATLFIALARAAGIPSRFALGLVYGNGSLYYHAWAEIFAGRWIAVDPTLGQFPADASHIRLIIGDLDKQAKIVSLIGKIRIEGLEYRE